ncbi:hypothetical protein [Nonlabens sp.]|uniref:hypothetical protein n=1 Tax=Nonlabens sp. TaxID=1888209 RepID=UPI003F6973CD
MNKTFYILILFLLVSGFSRAQNVLDNISIETNKCVTSTYETIDTNDFLQVSMVKECIESAAEKDMEELLKYYEIKSIKEFDLKEFCIEIIPYLIKHSNLTQNQLNIIFEDIIDTE